MPLDERANGSHRDIEVQFSAGVGAGLAGLPAAAELVAWADAALGRRSEPLALSLRVVDEAEMRELNKRYRQQDTPTNVLSFPAMVPDLPGVPTPLGDLAICATVVQREATEQGKPLEAHYCHMVIHGVLHLLGHDHQNDAEAEEMEAAERVVLSALGYPDPYAVADVDGERG